jgi:hypothetical protein
MKDSFYEELEHVFNKFLTCHMKKLLGGFNAIVGREDQQLGMRVYTQLVMIMELE